MRIADLVSLELETRVQVLQEMTPSECAQLFHDWKFWARDDQAAPEGDWIIWLILAGRGAGKTRAGAEAVRRWIDAYPIVNLIGATLADARDIMVKGESGILACCRPDERPEFHASDLRLEWPNGAVSQLFSAEEPDRLRGKQHMKLWCLAGDTLVSMGDGSKHGAQIHPRRRHCANAARPASGALERADETRRRVVSPSDCRRALY